ncbi:unnamed protein product [Dibothriocephalus latus]|uniref:Uncharacterized protein n=1 Tax=Dibothriocephalus latus TaxID=60516 RepID=A0A3P7LVP9_DIBLA|nr:unnamed protein product [Dibothriocephalus latus]
MRDQLREAADELHISMETARGIVNRRRTRLSTWQSTCATFESALLMNAEGEEVEGDQTLPVWIATIRQRLQQSGPDLSSPDFQKELVRTIFDCRTALNLILNAFHVFGFYFLEMFVI